MKGVERVMIRGRREGDYKRGRERVMIRGVLRG